MNVDSKFFMVRIISIVFFFFSLLPSIIIDFYDGWSAYNFVFIVFSFFLFFIGVFIFLWSSSPGFERQDCFGLVEKVVALISFILVIFIALRDAYDSEIYFQGYKFTVIFFVIFFSREIYRFFVPYIFLRDYRFLLSIYVIGVFLAALLIPGSLQSVGPTGTEYIRMDVTGSETTQGVLSALLIILILSDAEGNKFRRIGVFRWSYDILCVLASVYVFFYSGSRQALLAVVIYLVLMMSFGAFLGKESKKKFFRSVCIFFFLLIIFLGFSYFVDSSLYVRIFDNPSHDYTTGRLDYSLMWIDEMNNKGGILGFGYISVHSIQEIDLLWPSNEFARFYVEGGALGVIILFLIIAYSTFALGLVIRYEVSDFIRNGCSIVYSIILVQICFDNYFHGTYRALLYVMMVSWFAHHAVSRIPGINGRFSRDF